MINFCITPFKIELLGFIAGVLSTLSFLPQAILVGKTKSTKDISLGMYILYIASLVLWGIYAYLIESSSLLFAESATFVIAIYILIMKIYYR